MLFLCFIQGGTVILSGPGGPAVASVTPQTSELVGVVVHNTLLIHLLFILGCIFFNPAVVLYARGLPCDFVLSFCHFFNPTVVLYALVLSSDFVLSFFFLL